VHEAAHFILGRALIRTNIRAPRGKQEAVFSWISEWTDLVDERSNESRGMSIVLSQWFKQGVLQRGGVLSIDPAYIAITGGRERWLYRVARKHAGGNGPDGFTISLPTLFDKSGAEGPFRRFKFEIQKIAERNDLPGLFLAVEKTASGDPALRMIMREEAGEGTLPAPPAPASQGPRRPAASRPEKQQELAAPLPLFSAHLSPVDNPLLQPGRVGLSGTDHRLIGNGRVVFQEQSIGLSGTGPFCISLILLPKSAQGQALTL
jgi:hypothetical protein